MPCGSAHLRQQRGAAVSQAESSRSGRGLGGRAGVAAPDGPGPHRPFLPTPGPADGGAARGDRPGEAVAPSQPDHRQG